MACSAADDEEVWFPDHQINVEKVCRWRKTRSAYSYIHPTCHKWRFKSTETWAQCPTFQRITVLWSSYSSSLLALLDPDDEDTMILRNIHSYWPSDTVSYHSRPQSLDTHVATSSLAASQITDSSLSWKMQIFQRYGHLSWCQSQLQVSPLLDILHEGCRISSTVLTRRLCCKEQQPETATLQDAVMRKCNV